MSTPITTGGCAAPPGIPAAVLRGIPGSAIAAKPFQRLLSRLAKPLHAKEYQKAIALCTEHAFQVPINVHALVLLANIESFLGDYEAAVGAYQQALQLKVPDRATVQLLLDEAIDRQAAKTVAVVAAPMATPAPAPTREPAMTVPAMVAPPTLAAPAAPAEAAPADTEEAPTVIPPAEVMSYPSHVENPHVPLDPDAMRWLTPQRATVILVLAAVVTLCALLANWQVKRNQYHPTDSITTPIDIDTNLQEERGLEEDVSDDVGWEVPELRRPGRATPPAGE